MNYIETRKHLTSLENLENWINDLMENRNKENLEISDYQDSISRHNTRLRITQKDVELSVLKDLVLKTLDLESLLIKAYEKMIAIRKPIDKSRGILKPLNFSFNSSICIVNLCFLVFSSQILIP